MNPKYQYLINVREKVGLKRFNDPKAFIEYSGDMHDAYKNINYYNPDKEYFSCFYYPIIL